MQAFELIGAQIPVALVAATVGRFWPRAQSRTPASPFWRSVAGALLVSCATSGTASLVMSQAGASAQATQAIALLVAPLLVACWFCIHQARKYSGY